MNKKIALTVAFTWLTASAAFAGWTLVDAMNYADQAAMDATWSPYPIDTADGSGGGAVVATDPQNAANNVLRMNSGANTATTSAYNAFATRLLPAGSEISTLGTVYFRVKVPTVEVGGTPLRAIVDLVWGLSWRRPIADPNNPDTATEVVGSYNDFSVLARQEFDLSFDVFDQGNPAGTYQTVLVDGLGVDTWYQIWYVCDHANNAFKVYAQGPGLGTGDEQVLIYPFAGDTHPPIDWSSERSPSTEPLRSFLLYSSAGTSDAPKGLDYMFVDDIYVDNTGQNLTSPIEGGTMVNVSTRGLVGTGGEIMIVGFVIEGGPRTVLLRGVGPTLGGFGVAGTLEDPVITLFNSANQPIATNDDWGSAGDADAIVAAAAAAGAFPLGTGSLDAVLLMNLPNGSYTLQVTGKGGTGVALGEAYATK